jgi:hypothetical protein
MPELHEHHVKYQTTRQKKSTANQQLQLTAGGSLSDRKQA